MEKKTNSFIVRVYSERVRDGRTKENYYISHENEEFYLTMFIGYASKFFNKDEALLDLNKNHETIKNWFNTEKEELILKYEILEINYTKTDEGLL